MEGLLLLTYRCKEKSSFFKPQLEWADSLQRNNMGLMAEFWSANYRMPVNPFKFSVERSVLVIKYSQRLPSPTDLFHQMLLRIDSSSRYILWGLINNSHGVGKKLLTKIKGEPMHGDSCFPKSLRLGEPRYWETWNIGRAREAELYISSSDRMSSRQSIDLIRKVDNTVTIGAWTALR